MLDFVRFGIHVMAAQNHLGEVIIGDSHEYADFGPFDKAVIDDLILGYLRERVELPDWTLTERWHGVYASASDATPFPHGVAAAGG